MPTSYPIDVFISYSHVDDQPLLPGKKGMVTQMHDLLEILLHQKLGYEPEIWRDTRIRGNEVFRESLAEPLGKSALLLCIVTPRSIASDWCRFERQEFVRIARLNGGIEVQHLSRILNLAKTPVDPSKMPDVLKTTPGYNFFHYAKTSGKTVEFNPDFGQEYQELFCLKINDLSEDIVNTLNLLDDQQSQLRFDPHVSNLPTVFLAETSPGMSIERDHLARELKIRKYNVVPDHDFGGNRQELEEQIKKMLQDAVSAIHILGPSYSHGPWDSASSIEEIQFRLANEHFRGNQGKQIVWVPPGMQALNPNSRQSRLIELAREWQDGSDTLELFECSFDELKHTLFMEGYIHWRQPPSKNEPPFVRAKRPPFVYLVIHKQDQEAVKPITECLHKHGLEVIQTAFEGEESQCREDHEINLRDCDGVLIYYGSGSDLWLNEKIRDLQKVAGLGRTQPFEATAIALAPPGTPRKLTFRSAQLEVIDLHHGFQPEALQPFIDRLTTEDPAA